ncbi:MAG: RES family NAD+ phosphorylase, partial [Desulfobacterales bacterium]|nr:RES family NAD+ phosphorylase [Desulfobacterales bacterium]
MGIQVDKVLKAPIKELSAPPAMAAKHGRMNAAGISVFYGATDAETCIAEVRPPIGSHVVVGRFKIIQNIRLLDLNILSEIYATGSYFDQEFKRRKGHAAFLQRLVGELTKPVMPNKETLGYLPTQIVAEYLAEKVKPRL